MLKLVQTTFSETTIRLRYADDADPARAKQWLDFQFLIADLKHVSETPVRDPQALALGVLQAAALRRARDIASGEIQGRSGLADPRS